MNSPLTRRAYFVTGTDTDVGKTLVSRLLLQAVAAAGYDTVAMKPLAAGGVQTEAGWCNEDALLLQASATRLLPYAQINPVCLPDAVAPHLAAVAAGRRISAERLSGFCQGVLMQRAAFTLIEGAGGWRVPISEREYLSDVVRQLKLPVILVVGMKLGCLNHALLTAEAIHRDGLTLAGWVANTLDPAMPMRAENVATLQDALGSPLLADLPWLADTADISRHTGLVKLGLLGL